MEKITKKYSIENYDTSIKIIFDNWVDFGMAMEEMQWEPNRETSMTDEGFNFYFYEEYGRYVVEFSWLSWIEIEEMENENYWKLYHRD